MLHRLTVAASLAAALCASAPCASAAADAALQTVTFPDGIVGTVPDRCGAGDECGTLKLVDGDRVVIYNGGAPHCKPYALKLVRFHGDAVLFTSDNATARGDDSQSQFGKRCGDYHTTVLTVAGGHRLVLTQNTDGTLSGKWEEGLNAGRSARQQGRTTAPARTETSRETVDGHPRTCSVIENGSTTIAEWANPICDGARAQWERDHAAGASPLPSPAPSAAPSPKP